MVKSSVLVAALMAVAAPVAFGQLDPAQLTSLSNYLAYTAQADLSSLAAEATSALNNLSPAEQTSVMSMMSAMPTGLGGFSFPTPTNTPSGGAAVAAALPSGQPGKSGANSLYKPISAAALVISAVVAAGIVL